MQTSCTAVLLMALQNTRSPNHQPGVLWLPTTTGTGVYLGGLPERALVGVAKGGGAAV